MSPTGKEDPARSAAAASLAVLMAFGSVLLWTAIPAGWLRLAAELSDRAFTVYLLALLGCPASMILWAWGLHRLNARYLALRGKQQPTRRRPWESAAAGTASGGGLTLLDVFLIVSAVLAVIGFVCWYLFLADSPTSTPWPDELSG
jgi:hypothetical protein